MWKRRFRRRQSGPNGLREMSAFRLQNPKETDHKPTSGQSSGRRTRRSAVIQDNLVAVGTIIADRPRRDLSKMPEPGLLGGYLPMGYGGIAMLTDYISPEQHAVGMPKLGHRVWPRLHVVGQRAFCFSGPGVRRSTASGWFRCMTRADEISEIGKQYETKPGFYGDTANLSGCFCCTCRFTLCVNPQSVGERLK